MALPTSWSLTSGLQNFDIINSYCLKPLPLGSFVMAAPKNESAGVTYDLRSLPKSPRHEGLSFIHSLTHQIFIECLLFERLCSGVWGHRIQLSDLMGFYILGIGDRQNTNRVNAMVDQTVKRAAEK